MFEGTEENLKQTNVTQPAIFIHSAIFANCITNFHPNMVAGHSLGEFSALVSVKTLSFEDGLLLVIKRAEAMHIACKSKDSTMAAIIGLEASKIKTICKKQDGVSVVANYNSPSQIVISGDTNTIEKTCIKLTKSGAKRTVILPVGGAFHSPIMKSAKTSVELAINSTEFNALYIFLATNSISRALFEFGSPTTNTPF